MDYVTIDWYERDKKILCKTTDSGEEIGIRVEGGLQEGDILYEDAQRRIVVTIAPCDLIAIPVQTMEEMGRLCFELGNRHLSLSIGADLVRCPYDAPTLAYLRKLGFAVQLVHDKFDHYIQRKAHAHTHSHDHHDA